MSYTCQFCGREVDKLHEISHARSGLLFAMGCGWCKANILKESQEIRHLSMLMVASLKMNPAGGEVRIGQYMYHLTRVHDGSPEPKRVGNIPNPALKATQMSAQESLPVRDREYLWAEEARKAEEYKNRYEIDTEPCFDDWDREREAEDRRRM